MMQSNKRKNVCNQCMKTVNVNSQHKRLMFRKLADVQFLFSPSIITYCFHIQQQSEINCGIITKYYCNKIRNDKQNKKYLLGWLSGYGAYMPSLKDDISWTVSEFKLAQLLSVHNVKELNNHGKLLSLAEKKSEIMHKYY